MYIETSCISISHKMHGQKMFGIPRCICHIHSLLSNELFSVFSQAIL